MIRGNDSRYDGTLPPVDRTVLDGIYLSVGWLTPDAGPAAMPPYGSCRRTYSSGVQPAKARNSRIMCDWSKYPQSKASAAQRGGLPAPMRWTARRNLKI